MTDAIESRARQLLADIGLKEPDWNPPPGHAEYDALVAFVAGHLRQVAAEARGAALVEAAEAACNFHFDAGEHATAVGFETVIFALRDASPTMGKPK